MNSTIRSGTFVLACAVVAAIVFAGARAAGNDYVFFAGYTVLQFIVLATAWNILGGYTGYVNFGSAAFFALGAYATVFFHKFYPMPVPVLLIIGAVVSGLVGLGMGYLTLRLRGAFFAIATLALAVVLQTLVVNWNYVGGARGAYVIRPAEVAGLSLPYIQYLFLIMLALAVLAIATARIIERSKLGYGFAAIRDDEMAAEASGVPTLRLKLIATTLSGALMGMAGAPFPYYIGYLQPSSAFALEYAVNSIAMPMIGGATTWVGPLIGAILLGTLQQFITVTISSAVGLLVVGVLLVAFVTMAPNGIVGLVQDFLRATSPSGLTARPIAIILIAAICFLDGILVAVNNLALVTSAGVAAIPLGSAGLVFAALQMAAAYALLKLHRFGPRLTMILFAVSIAVDFFFIWSAGGAIPTMQQSAGILFKIAVITFLLSAGVQELYRLHKLERRNA
jgi:branched-chain amino acid transport system permease protein